MTRTATFIVIAAGLLATSCGEPSRERNVQRIASTACDRFDECGNLDDYDYSSYDECLSDMESSFYDSWPEDECSDGQINMDRYRDCLDRADSFACDANFFDFLSFVSECNAEKVCTDPRK
jgi:hypothetical protein